MKKIIFLTAVVLTIALLSGCTPKEDKQMDDQAGMTEDSTMQEDSFQGFQLESGTIVSVEGDNRVLIKNENQEVVLNSSKSTPKIDAMAGASPKKVVLEKDRNIFAWVSSAYTASMPPQTMAYAIFVNAETADDLPAMIEVESITEEEGGYLLTAMDGKKWMLSKDIEVNRQADSGIEKSEIKAVQQGVIALVWKNDEDSMEDISTAVKVMVLKK